jgi:hypothetical protein
MCKERKKQEIANAAWAKLYKVEKLDPEGPLPDRYGIKEGPR